VQGVELVRLVSPTGVGGHHLLLAAAGRFWALECEPAAGRTIEGFFSRMRPSKP
jgi:hypothetical protein